MDNINYFAKETHKYNTRYQKNMYDSNNKDDNSSINNEDNSSINNEDNEDNEDNENYNRKDYHKLLSEIFPSKYMTDKYNTTKRINNKRKKYENTSDSDGIEENLNKSQYQTFKIHFKKKQKNKSKKKYQNTEDKEKDSDEEYNEEEYSEEEDSEEEDSDEEYNEEEDSEEEDSEEEDSEEEDSEEEDSEEEDSEEEDSEEEDNKKNNKILIDTKSDNIKISKFKNIYNRDQLILNKFKNLAEKLKNKKEKEIEKKKDLHNKNIKNRLYKKFEKILDQDTCFDEEKYFKKNLDIEKQEKLIEEFSLIKQESTIDKPYLIKLIESPIPVSFKAVAFKKINTLRSMSENTDSNEYYKIRNWVDNFMKIPFGTYNDLPIVLNDGLDKCHEFMENAKNILDQAVFGLNDAKLQIMQLIGQWIVNPNSAGTAIAIRGPMGTGKTTLIKEGISKILNRPFTFVALGGATDSAFLEGHSYTYDGSVHGKIVDILIQTKCMNPIIYCDELDKISDTPKGEEITGILTHLTDSTQNSQFHDKYFSEFDFDLNRALFIFSYNDEEKINPILKDRMYRIETKGYTKEEKVTIVNNYLLPKIQEQVNIKSNKIIIPTEVINYIIEKYTEKEDGVRNLKRCLEIIYTKLNLYRLMKPGINLFEKDLDLKIDFPNKEGEFITLTENVIDKLIKQLKKGDDPPFGMYN